MVAKENLDSEALLRNALQLIAPGTSLRDGLERILRGHTGALVVLGYDRNVDHISGGGFELDVEFSATRLRELAKMDGAIIVDTETGRIVRAAVQLLPDPTIATSETGTRHRTADRVAKQTGLPVVSVSKSMNLVALYVSGRRYVLEGTPTILSRANQSISTLERFRARLDQVSGNLAALEVEDLVTVRDVALFTQRLELVRRIRHEIDGFAIELGVDGRHIALQAEELGAGVDAARELLVRDYMPASKKKVTTQVAGVINALNALNEADLLDLVRVASALGVEATIETLDASISPRGYRLLARLPRLNDTIRDRVISHFGSLQSLLLASTEDLQKVEGVGDARARAIRDGITRVSEATILERLL